MKVGITAAKVLIISPHCDDAVFSCGGFMALCASNGIPVTVLNVFESGSNAPQRASAFARSLLAKAGLCLQNAVPSRRAEDRRALTRLGVHGVYLGLPDAVFRMTPSGFPLYLDERSLTRPRSCALSICVDRIAPLIRKHPITQNPDSLILSPSGIGRHVDHLTCAEALMRLRRRQRVAARILFYEDFPYCIASPCISNDAAQCVRLTA